MEYINAIIGDSDSLAFKICLWFGIIKLARATFTLFLWIPFQYLFLKGLTSLMETVLGHKRL